MFVGLGKGGRDDQPGRIFPAPARGTPHPYVSGCNSAMTAANTAAMTADNIGLVWTTLECRRSTRTTLDGPGGCAHSYGSHGRARHVPDRVVSQGSSRSFTMHNVTPATMLAS